MTPKLARIAYGLALVAAVLPLWAGRQLPIVDLPQHLHLISVLHRLHDPTTLYPGYFRLRPELTPYLGYYYLVDLLSWLMPLEVANKVFLSAYVIGLPLAMAFLLRSLGRPRWASLLAIPFAYGDSFAWGFINYCACLPLVLLDCGLFVRAITDPLRRRRWATWHAVVLIAVLLFHIQGAAFLGLGLPWLLLTTRAPDDPGLPIASQPFWRQRVPALLSVLPALGLFLIWVVGRVGEPTPIKAGAPWKAWGPLLSAQNLSFKSFAQNRDELWEVLANQLRDGSDRWSLTVVVLLAAAAVVSLFLAGLGTRREGKLERWRLLGLGALALVLYFTLPFDIRGYMYYLNTRFAHLAAPLVFCAVPPVAARARRWLCAGGLGLALVTALPLARGFAAFQQEAEPLVALADQTPPRPKIVGLIYEPRSAVVTHPVFLHAATVLARLNGGVTNFSFASTPHSPLMFAGEPLPTFPSEWRPGDFRYDTMGPPYDAFLVRGAPPEAVFGSHLGSELTLAAQAGTFYLVRRR